MARPLATGVPRMLPGRALIPALIVARHSSHDQLRIITLDVAQEARRGIRPQFRGDLAVVSDHHDPIARSKLETLRHSHGHRS